MCVKSDILSLIKNKLEEKNWTISVVESVTGGHVCSQLTSLPGSSHFFQGALCAYSLAQKVNLLGVDKVEAKKVDCISFAIAKQMAIGCKKLFETEVALSTTGHVEGENAFCFCSIVINDSFFQKYLESFSSSRKERQEELAYLALSFLSTLFD